MATNINKVDSNITGLRIAEEVSPKVLPGTPVWNPMEPNSYSDFGGSVSTTARNPINPSRQKKKGVITDLDASGGFNSDLTQTNLQNLMQGFLFANFRTKSELGVTAVDGATEKFTVASGGAAYLVGDLVFAKGLGDAANNGLHVALAGSTGTAVAVATNLTTAATQSGTISRVGYRFGAGEVNVDITSQFPALVSTARSWLTFGFSEGEWVYVGGDLAGQRFSTAGNNGFARIRSISATRLSFDKTQSAMANETGTGKTIDVYFGRVLKNEVGSLIVRRTYQLERTLGAPDTAQPTQIQSEYLTGAVPNELTINIPRAEKVTADMAFVAMDHELRTGVTGVKSGTRPALVEADAFNTTSDFSRIKLAAVDDTNSAILPLFAYAESLTMTVNNGVEPDKAIGVLGAFDTSAGTFMVSAKVDVYFTDVTAIAAVRANTSVTLDAHIVKNRSGVTIDVPLIALGDGRPNIEQDKSIKLPLTADASTGALIDSKLDHTLLFVFWDYLPLAADL